MKQSTVKGNWSDHSHWVQAVARACDLLAGFGPADEVLPLHDLAARCNLSKATTYRLLCTLEAKGFVERLGRGVYRSKIKIKPGKRCRIGLSVHHDSGAFLGAVAESITGAARNAEVDLLTHSSRGNRKASVTHTERLTHEGVSVVIELQPDAKAGAKAAELYAKAGVPVIAVGFPQPGAYYFGPDRYRAGRLAGLHLARWAARNWGGQVDELLLLEAEAYGPAMQALSTGLEDGLTAGLLEVRGVSLTRLDTRGAFDLSLDLVRRHYRRRSVRRMLVAGVNDAAALGALEAIRESGLETSCAIAGQDGTLEARRELRRAGSRFIGTVAYFPESYGEQLLRLALDCANRKPIPRAGFSHQTLLTAANVDQIYAADLLRPSLLG